MPGDTSGDDLDAWTRDWIQDRAAEAGVPPERFLKRLAAAFRAAEEGEVPALLDESALDPLTASVDDLEGAVDALQRDVDEKVEDVRERVIQVKRETDAKAPADHGHDDLATRLDGALETAARAESRVADLRADLEALEDSVDDGFENFEAILAQLDDAVGDVESKTTRLARAVVSMQDVVEGVTEREGRRIAADRLRDQANTHGVRTATCDDCGASLDVALLVDARCPHCASTFASVEPKQGFFGSATLVVGDRPALEAPDAPDVESTIADLAADGDGRADPPRGTDRPEDDR